MRFSTEQFISLPTWRINTFAPTLNNTSDICLLTHESINNLKHPVKASDDRIYDAYALHYWLSKGKSFVIPGRDIVFIDSYSWYTYGKMYISSISNCLHFFNNSSFYPRFFSTHVMSRLCSKVIIKKRKKSINIKTAIDTIVRLQQQNKNIKKSKIIIPSTNSAFSLYPNYEFGIAF